MTSHWRTCQHKGGSGGVAESIKNHRIHTKEPQPVGVVAAVFWPVRLKPKCSTAPYSLQQPCNAHPQHHAPMPTCPSFLTSMEQNKQNSCPIRFEPHMLGYTSSVPQMSENSLRPGSMMLLAGDSILDPPLSFCRLTGSPPTSCQNYFTESPAPWSNAFLVSLQKLWRGLAAIRAFLRL